MTPDAASVSPHGSRQRRFPYMSASTYFPLQHRCWLKSSLHPARCSGSLIVFRAWNQTHAVMIRSDWTPSPSVQHFLTRRAWIYSPWPRSPFGSLAGPGLTQTWPWELHPLHPGVMGIQGMELFAIGVVIILFMAVLKQFGILEPMSSFEGKGPREAPGACQSRVLFR